MYVRGCPAVWIFVRSSHVLALSWNEKFITKREDGLTSTHPLEYYEHQFSKGQTHSKLYLQRRAGVVVKQVVAACIANA